MFNAIYKSRPFCFFNYDTKATIVSTSLRSKNLLSKHINLLRWALILRVSEYNDDEYQCEVRHVNKSTYMEECWSTSSISDEQRKCEYCVRDSFKLREGMRRTEQQLVVPLSRDKAMSLRHGSEIRRRSHVLPLHNVALRVILNYQHILN
jgi:hypothetical protein